jgi:hypothetical protein
MLNFKQRQNKKGGNCLAVTAHVDIFNLSYEFSEATPQTDKQKSRSQKWLCP